MQCTFNPVRQILQKYRKVGWGKLLLEDQQKQTRIKNFLFN